jgi:heme exporter protein C
MSGSALHRFANPGRFLRLASRVLPWLAAATALSFAVGLYFALWASPPDYQQKETVRIMYIHVPAASPPSCCCSSSISATSPC